MRSLLNLSSDADSAGHEELGISLCSCIRMCIDTIDYTVYDIESVKLRGLGYLAKFSFQWLFVFEIGTTS